MTDATNSPRSQTLAVVGFGNMGCAVVAGAIHAQVIHPREILVVESDHAKRGAAAALGCATTDDAYAARDAESLLLAVKPQSFDQLAPRLSDRAQRTVIVSVMAGLAGNRIRSAIGEQHAVIRAMPNTPCRIGAGMTAIAASAGAVAGDELLAERLFGSIGRVLRVEETMLDAVTATSASGPAYLFLLAEAWEDAAIALGFDRPSARTLVQQTILGAAAMLAEGTTSPAELRAAVTSRGGTTAAAIAELERHDLRAAMRDALAAALRRSQELGAAQA